MQPSPASGILTGLNRVMVACTMWLAVGGAIDPRVAQPPDSHPPVSQPSAPVRYLLTLDAGDRMTMPVTMDDGRALRFLIDTGAEQTGVSNERAMEFNLARSGQQSIIGYGGRQTVPVVVIRNLGFAKSNRANIRALSFAGRTIGADGFLGLDSLDGLKVRFDFLNHRLEVRNANRWADRARIDAFDVPLRARHGRLMFAGARVNGVKADIVLDTGSSLTIGNVALRDRLVGARKIHKLYPVTMLTLTGELLQADYGIVDSLLIDGVLVNNLPLAFARVEPFDELGLSDHPALFLGMDALGAFESVEVDFRHQTMRFVATAGNRPGTLFQLDGQRF